MIMEKQKQIEKCSKEIYEEVKLNIINQGWGPYEAMYFLDTEFYNYYKDLLNYKLGIKI